MFLGGMFGPCAGTMKLGVDFAEGRRCEWETVLQYDRSAPVRPESNCSEPATQGRDAAQLMGQMRAGERVRRGGGDRVG